MQNIYEIYLYGNKIIKCLIIFVNKYFEWFTKLYKDFITCFLLLNVDLLKI